MSKQTKKKTVIITRRTRIATADGSSPLGVGKEIELPRTDADYLIGMGKALEATDENKKLFAKKQTAEKKTDKAA